MKFTATAPAKINLSLRILRKRDDGFHELSTRMAPLTLADRLTLECCGSPGTFHFTCSDPSVPSDESNLVVKAFRAIERLRGPLPGMAIHLEKCTPHGAGLGGGSSDAAIALRLIDQAADLQLPQETLLSLAAELGSDVPFFLMDAICDCTGRGEHVTPVPGLRLQWRILLIKLPFGVPTPWAYAQWKDSLEIPGIDYSEQEIDGTILVNDLERPVFQKHFILAELKHWLRHQPGVRGTLMSGSGSTVFAVLAPEANLSALETGIHDLVGAEVWLQETHLAI